nr:IgGFc-binding protein [Candidatus Kapabacteria bacterium]
MRSVILVLMLMLGCLALPAREADYITKNSEGREFWLCFMKNFREAGQRDPQNRQEALRLQLFLTSSFDATVRIEIEEIQYDNTITIKANTVVNVQIPARAQVRAVETGERLAVHVTADTTISVYGLNSRFQTTDTFLGLPVSVLGTDYRAVGYTKLASDLLSAVSIVATEDETEVTIVPTVATSTGRPAGRPFTARLRKGDVYTIGARWESIGACDLTGTSITSNKKIAVFSGHNCAYVPPKVEACNHLVEQLPPVSAWGKHYYLGMLKERSKYTYRVIASQD